MFDSLTRSKFYTKCKSLIKITKARLEASRKKKKVVANYLKNDIADLLKTGFHSNAYSRTQGLIFELNLIATYKFVEDFCDCISTKLAVLDKQKECPKECREAIQSLMYAAARLAEFPELCNLRSLFAHRYGDCLELYINKEFGELLNPKLATKEMKLELLGDVAQEFSIKWDPEFLEEKLFNFKPPHSIQQNQHINGGSNNREEDDDHKTKKSKDDVFAPSSEKNCGSRLKYNFQEDGKRQNHNTSAENMLGRSEVEVASPTRKNVSDEKHMFYSSSRSEGTDRDNSQPNPSSILGITSTAAPNDEVDNISNIRYRFLPLPSIRTRLEKHDVKDQSCPKSSSPDTVESQPKPRSVRRIRRQMKTVMSDENVGSPLKPTPGHAYFGSFDAVGSSGMIFGRSNKGNIWKVYDDDEEQHSKKSAPYERHNMRSYYKLKPLSWKSRKESGKEELEHGGDPGSAPTFASLGKTAFTATTSSNGGTRSHARSLSAESGHPHPYLPKCDLLAARVAAFQGK